jgi:hypothetical protein
MCSFLNSLLLQVFTPGDVRGGTSAAEDQLESGCLERRRHSLPVPLWETGEWLCETHKLTTHTTCPYCERWSYARLFLQPFGHEQTQQKILEERTILNAKEVNFPTKPPVTQLAQVLADSCSAI